MMRATAVVATLILLLAGAPARAGDAETGRALAEAQCAECHALDLTGTSPYPGAQPFRKLRERWREEDLARALETGIIAEHAAAGVVREMRLAPAEITDFLAFLRTLEVEDETTMK